MKIFLSKHKHLMRHRLKTLNELERQDKPTSSRSDTAKTKLLSPRQPVQSVCGSTPSDRHGIQPGRGCSSYHRPGSCQLQYRPDRPAHGARFLTTRSEDQSEVTLGSNMFRAAGLNRPEPAGSGFRTSSSELLTRARCRATRDSC